MHKSWFFLPRKASKVAFDDQKDQSKATNLLFKCSEDFSEIKMTRIGKLTLFYTEWRAKIPPLGFFLVNPFEKELFISNQVDVKSNLFATMMTSLTQNQFF